MSSILRWGYFRPLILLIVLPLNQLGCVSEEDFTFDGSKMHGPLGITTIPGENIALVISTNFDFSNTEDDPEQQGGIIHAIDLNTFELNTEAAVQIPNFGGQIRVDTTNQQLFLADRNDSAVRVFDYTIPGSNGKIIEITPVKTLDGGESTKNPFSIYVIKPTDSPFTKVFVANIETDDLSLIDADDLEFIDLNPNDSDSDALPLDEVAVGSIDLTDQLIRPNRMVSFGSDDLVLLSVTAVSLIYVIDTKNNGIEAIIDLQGIDAGAAIHGMAVTDEKLAYLAFQGADAIAVIDLSGLSDNGIDQETITPNLVQIIPTGGDIEDIKLSSDGSKIYAANLSRNSVMVFDAVSGTLLTEILVGSGPTEMELTISGSELMVTNFFSDSVSVIDTATDTVTTTIE